LLMRNVKPVLDKSVAESLVREITNSGLPEEGGGSVFQDSRGRIWASSLTGAGYIEKNRLFEPRLPAGS
jgi:hypothetical protein